MDRIEKAKRQVRLNNWQRMYEEYLASGQTVQQWCADNNITPKTYYYRLRKLRDGALKQEQHEIVPVRDSVEDTKILVSAKGCAEITAHYSKKAVRLIRSSAGYYRIALKTNTKR